MGCKLRMTSLIVKATTSIFSFIMRTALILFLLCASLRVNACDICGHYMGVTPYQNKHSISLMHRYRIFNGYRDYQTQSHFFPASAYRIMHGGNDTLTEGSQTHSSKDFESYKIVELRIKYFVLKRLEVNAFVPLLSNRSMSNDVLRKHTGLGDVSLNTGFHLILPNDTANIKHKLILGAGLKMPTGNYYAHDQFSDRLPFEMQPGTGSFDGFVYLNYVLVSNKLGASLSLNFKYNGHNQFKERLGNSTTNFLSVFYKLRYKQVMFFPSVQCNYEYTKGLYIKNQLQNNTNVNALMLGPGLDLYYKSFSVNLSWQFTAFEETGKGELKSAGRLSAGINYNFGK